MVPNYSPSAIIPVRGEGSRLWDDEGNEYLDLAAGIAVNAVGHCHPVVVAALEKQAHQLWHLSNAYTNKPILAFAEKLIDNTFAEKVYFANSGGEVNEAAFKLARKYAQDHYGVEKNQIIAFENGFHGRTLFTVSVGGQPKYTKGFEPLPQGITHLPFNDIQKLEAEISDKTCAVVIEPIQGEGGILPADQAFLEKARELCDRFNAVLVFDEIQTGMGRTGDLFAYMGYGVVPDILTSAKAIGAGFPMAAMLTTDKVAASLGVGSHGSTYGGNALAGAVGNAVFDIINTEQVLQGVKDKSVIFKDLLNTINEKYQVFDEIRGKGLMLGCALSEAWRGKAKAFIGAGIQHNVMVLMAGPDTIRLVPSLLISNEEIHEALARFERAVAQLVNQT
jgi:acetylornithine/N-succinyldiaminopimelate aminotransferase